MDLGYIVLVLLIGFVAQLVDGSLGMGYGVTSATLLATIGFAPAVASATIHVAKIGTGLMSGTAHWRFGNVHWRAVFMLAIPGTIGAFVGALAISYIAAEVAAPWVSVILAVLGVVVLLRTVFGRKAALQFHEPRTRLLGPLGLIGGFIDSVGGGGWGPVTTSTLMATNRMSPNQVIGTVSMSEFIVAIGASVGFLVALGSESHRLGSHGAAAAWRTRRGTHRRLAGEPPRPPGAGRPGGRHDPRLQRRERAQPAGHRGTRGARGPGRDRGPLAGHLRLGHPGAPQGDRRHGPSRQGHRRCPSLTSSRLRSNSKGLRS